MNLIYTQLLQLHNSFIGAAKLAHWNVVGADFYQNHLLFELVYSKIEAHLDGLAEQVRALGVEIPASVFNSVPELDWETSQDLHRALLGELDELTRGVLRAREEADEDRLYGLVASLDNLVSDCNSVKYLLRSAMASD